MKLLLILSSIFLSSMAYSQQDSTSADTIALSVTHQTLLPQLMSQQAWLNNLKQPGVLDAAIADVAEKINILLTAYIDEKQLQSGKIQLGKEGKLIVQ